MKKPSYLNTIYSQKFTPMGSNYPSQLVQHLIEKFNLKAGDKVLDVGCGRGDFSKAFMEAGLKVSGLDREKTNTDLLSHINVKYCDCDHEKFPFPDNSFDMVFSKSVIEHMYDPDHFMTEQLRVLKTGGRLIILTPDWVSQMKIFWNDHTHRRPYTVEGVRRILMIYGLKNTENRLFYQYPLYWKYPFFLLIAKTLGLLGPVRKLYKNKFYRWSRELMILGTGIKN